MKRVTLRFGLVLGLLALTSPQLWANVTITSPTGGVNISADKALNSTNGAAFTALGNIVIAEVLVSDFSAGTSQTFILAPPTGWRFQSGAGTVSFGTKGDITAASISVTSSNATITLTLSGTTKLDTLTISGLQVQALDGSNMAGDYIRTAYPDPGTEVIGGIDPYTTFGLLNLVPGAAKALLMQTQPGATSTAGALFAPQPAVQVMDQFGNLRNLDSSTVISAALASGSGPLQGSLKSTAVFGVATYTNLSVNVAGTITLRFSATNLTSVTSAPIVVGPAPAQSLVFTTQPGSASSGVPFGIQPVIKTQDRFGSFSTVGLPASQLVTVTLSAGSGTLVGTTTLDIGSAAGNGTVSFTNLQIDAAGTGKQITATSPGLTNAVSASFGVSSALYSQLQVLLPGETAAPGTLSGKTGTPNAQAAGTPFNMTVNAVDTNWNLVNTIVDTVGITSPSPSAILPANAALVSGTKTFSVTLNTVGNTTLTATDLTDGSKSPNTSSSITVGGGTPKQLVIQTPPSSSATAGVALAQQPVIAVQDAGGNLVATDNGRVITVARALGTGALQGTLTATTVNGLATFTNLSYNLAEIITLNFTATSLTNVSSGNIAVATGPFSKLQLLVPGQTAAPGTINGFTGTPSAQVVGGAFPATVKAVDSFYNLINTVSDTVSLSSSDSTATLPPAVALAGGTTNVSFTFNTNGSFTLTASDLTDSGKTPSTSPAITVAPPQFTQATGGSAISADGAATSSFTSLTGPSYSEKASGNVGTGTIILKAPAGFVFDTGGTAPTVKITGGTASKNINAVSSGTSVAMSSVTSTQLTFTVTSTSNSGVTNTLSWQNVRVRPSAGTPLALGNLTRAGTASVVGLSTNSNLGTLREVAGAASVLAIQTQPSASATAGVIFAQQPVLQVRDRFGNLRSSANGVSDSTVVSAARGAGSGTLQGSLNATATNGIATFVNLSHNVATNITLAFSASGLTGTNSSIIAVSPAAASKLVFATQPGSSSYGSALSPQPMLKTQDAFGNDSTVSLGASQMVSLSLSAGTGSLQGTATLDIGTAAGNGMVSFSGLTVNMVGSGKQLSATSTGLTSAVSSTFSVSQATVTGSVTVSNKVYDGTTAAAIATRTLNGALAGDDVSLSGGTATFSSKSVGTGKTVSVTGLSLSGASAANYQLASTSASTIANITPRALAVSATATNKVYDGTTTATVSLTDNRVAGDSLTDTYTSASFADKNVGTAKTVSVSGIAISGTDSANYSANTSTTTTANITARALTVSATGINKVYDGTTNATVTLSDNRLGGDSLSTSYTSASFATRNVGTAKTVSVSGISLTGTDSANYTFNSTASTTANISARSLSITATGINKVYDGSTSATVSLSDNRVAGDSLSTSYTNASFASKSVGTAKTVNVTGISISGTDAANYSANTTAIATADITARALTVSATGINKVYDATTAATVTLSDNRLSGDSLTDAYASASFADKNVGTAKAVSVSGITISGTDAGNYTANATASTTANITAATVTAQVGVSNKIYDGTTAATILTNWLQGVLGSDNVSLNGGSASFANKNVGTGKTVTVIGLSLSGTDSGNYGFNTTATTTANITALALSVSAAGLNKVYDGTTNATVTLSDNRLSGDSLSTTYINASYADKNIGTAKTVNVSGISISGTDALNYTANTSTSTSADITLRSLSVSATGINKVYDATTNATVTLVDNRVSGDSLSTTYTNASFADKNVGTAKPVTVSGISISGTDAANYSPNTTTNATANITARGLTVSGVTANNKSYDATTTATLSTIGATLSGVLSGDSVNLNTGSGTGAFVDKNAGAGKAVNVAGLTLSGTDAGNYTLTQPSTTANITQAGLTVTANNQTRAAGQSNPTLTASYSGFVGGETLATSGVTGSPALSTTTTNVAGTYPITAAMGSLSSVNYSFSFVNGVLTVTPASANSLVIVTQPSSSATAGVAFAQQPAIAIRDAYGNLRSTDNSTVITAARNAGSGTLQGTLSATAVNGVVTFVNLSHNVANTINLSFSSSGLTNVTSANIQISPAAFSRLQLLVPGQSSAPGTTDGFTGTPSVEIAGTGFGVTVNAVDPFWNLVNSASDMVNLGSSDATAILPAGTALAAGNANLMVFLNTNGSFTLTASDLSDSGKTPSISPAITVSPPQFTQATDGSAIPADRAASSTFTNLTGPSYSENASGNVGTGTIILKAPAGFVFDTGGTAPTVLVTRLTGSGSNGNNINGVASGTAVAMTSVTTTQLVFTVTSSSASGITCKLTWQNVRIRPTAGTPLANGSLSLNGTAVIVGVSTNSNLGNLREVAGAANNLAIQTQPPATATAGVIFAQQPVLQVRDQFGNLRSSANGVSDSTVVSVVRGAGSGTLQGTLNATATNGIATFVNLSHNVATNITLAFSASGLTSTNSSTIALNPAAASKLVFATQPGSSIYGSALGPQPVLQSQDAFGNNSTVGLGSSQLVSLSLSTGTGTLQGTTALDIGTAAGNGTASFSGLALSAAGTGKQLGASSTGLTSALSSTFSISQATVTGSVTVSNKVYDGTTAAAIATRTLTGALAGDDVNLGGGTATFSSKTVGTGKTVSVNGLSLSGASAANYQLASTSASTIANITPRALAVSATATNKVYDGTTTATVSLTDNRVAGDSLTDTFASASFADKNVGTAKTVSVSGIAISGTDAANYSVNTSTTTTANITARALTVSATGINKVYDGSINATVTLSDNRPGGDSLSTSYTSASFATRNVGTAKAVSVSGITVSGTDSGNYTFNSTASTTASITGRALTVSATGANKVYDGTTSATVTLSDNRVSGDSLTDNYTSASFASKSVGTAKTVNVTGISVSGTDAANYSANTTAIATADITARALTVSVTGVNKVYDATTAATVTLSDNRLSGDSLADAYTSASFADKNVGTAKSVSVSGITISGTDAGNYTANATASTTANITAASLTALVTASNKVYDGTTAATLSTSSLQGVLGSDNVSLSGGSATFATKTVGTAKTVTVTGLSLSGSDAGNYQLGSSTASTTANITARSLTVSAIGINRVYDGTTSATVTLSDNRVAGDSLTNTYTSASFADKNVGTAKTVSVSGISISGTDAPNYTANTTASTTASITARSLSVTATGNDKVYDGTTTATVTLVDNRIGGDSLTEGYTSASFATKTVGTSKTVSVNGIAISGTDALNYAANTTASTTANITAKGLTVSGITANNKAYDATTAATLNTIGATLSGVLSGDSVNLNTGSATGAFADKNVGTAKTVNVAGLSLSGIDASNYTLGQPTTTASITKAGLTVTADNQTRAAGQSNPTLTASYSGFVGGETLATSGVTGSPALSTTITNVAGTYAITAAQGTLSAVNYSFSFVNGVLTVTPASANSLVIVTQPSSSATAGVAFAQQPVIAIRDVYGNLRSSDNSTVITAARNAGSGTLQGSLSATAVNGVATFVNLSHNVANTINLSFSSSGLTNVTSANIQVSPAAFSQLQLLAPGETAAPGSASGKNGTPSAQIVGTGFGVTINAVDGFYNLINTVNDTVSLSSSDGAATLPPATTLAAGTTNLLVTFNSNGSFTLTASDLSDGTKAPSTSPAITVSGAQFVQATGGSAILADSAASSTFTNLTGPSYSENASGNVGTGTIILKAPTGFVFDTGGTAPTVLVTRLTGSGSNGNNVNGVASGTVVAMTSVSSTQLVFTVTSSSASGVTCKLTWQNVRVRPSAGTPLAIGNLTRAGTASVIGLSTNANLGTLREVAGAANNLAIQTQPSATATAGVIFAQQPVLQVRDQFGNLRSSSNGVSDSTVVSVVRAAGSGTLQGPLNASATNGIATFVNLSHNVATNITLAFSGSGLTGTNSSVIVISPIAADHLVFAVQPGSTIYSSALSPQPVLKTQDPFGNNSTVGLGASQMVSLSLSSGSGTLLGTATLDIGTAAGNGIVSFSGLTVNMVGSGKQLSAASTGLTSALSSTFSISQATVTGSVTVSNKVYDGTTAAAIATRTLTGALAGDDVNLGGGTATFSSKTVGTGKTVSVNGLSLSGASAANYQLASTSASTIANITPRALAVSATATNKVYDGTTTATVSLTDNRVAGDSLTDTFASASFADKNVGTAKTVSVSGIAISGTDAANYSVNTSTTTTANITARALTVSATGINKVYDGSINATVTLSDNRPGGDSLSTSYTSASFATRNVGTAKAVSVSGITVSGTDSGNYTFNSTASTTASITGRALTVSATGANKVYDGTTSATVTLSDNRVSGDSLTDNYTSASFASKSVGTAKTVNVTGISVSGTDAANYSANTTAIATADITARALTVSVTGVNKVYDATTAATVTLSDNRLSGDSLADAYTSASFADKNVGTAKSVSVSGITISGTDAGNYTANATASTTANITAASLTALVTASNKVYDGTTAATLSTSSLQGVLGSDNVSLSGGSATFATKTVGTAKTVTVTGLSLSGSDAGNYQLGSSTASTTANITARSLTVSAIGINRVYDGTTSATVTLSDNRVAGDSLTNTYTSASFADKNVGTAKTVSVSGISISGTDAPNYTANTTASTTASITARSLSVTATGNDKVYDGTTTATVTLVDNRIGGDSLTEGYTSASFATKTVGTSKTVSVNGIAISGTDALNYAANTTASTTANITAKGLTVSGITANNKAYDATTAATLNTIGATLSGVLSGDSVNLNTGSATGAFADKNVGTAKTVNVAGLSLSGIDASNYTLGQPTTTASITKAGLTVTADNQTRAAGQSNPTLTASYSGFVGGETLATSGVTGSPALSTTITNVAGTYAITAAQGTLSAVNYSFSFVNGVLTVTPASANSLVIVTQPSSSATAGVAFAQQPVIAIRDVYGNLRSSDNSTVITAARNAGSGTLQGSLSATAVNGVATFVNLSHNVANTINLSFSSSGLTNVTSANIQVSPAAFSQLQLLAPGETAAPGSASGKNGTPSAQVASTGFPVTVNAVDPYWNLVNTVNDTVGLSCTNSAATLPAATAMAGGTTNLMVYFSTNGSFTLTAGDLTDSGKAASVSSIITVAPAQFTQANGGSAIPADRAISSTFTNLTGPTYSENASGNAGTGTIILKAPTGFIFDTGGTAPTVLVTRLAGAGSNGNNINGVASGTVVAMTSVTTTQLVFTVTSSSASGITCKLTWQNVRVRPSAGTPLAVGSLSCIGTASLVGVSTNSNLGSLREVASGATSLAIQTQPSATATAGAPFSQQPVVQVLDQFGNLRSSANGVSDSTVVSVVRGAGSGTLQGPLNASATNGIATFVNLSHNVATNITLAFSASGLTGTNSSTIAVGPAAASQLVFATQPGNGTVGVPLATQPVLITRDPFGNNSAAGLGASKNVTVTLSAGGGPLLGAATLDIGSSAGNGVVAFTNLSIGSPGTNNQFTASAAGLSSAVSSFFNITKNSQSITFGAVPNQVYGNAPFTPSATASSGLPVTFSIVSGPAIMVANTVTITGVGTVTVQAAQAGDTAWTAATPVVQSFTVAKAILTVTADNRNRAYGTTNPVLTASYTGFVNGENATVLTGSPSLSTTATMGSSVPGGPYPITVTQGTLNAANYNFAFVPGALTITKAPLTVTAIGQGRLYGASNPSFTFSYSGFLNGDDASVVSGSPTLGTTATATSPVAGSPYPITVALGTLSALNYTFVFAAGQLTITPASSLTTVVSLANPSPTGSNIAFTATLAGVAPSTGVPTGTVQFMADGLPLSAPVNLVGGAATLTSATLGHGIHTIAAGYAGDGNFFGSTNALGSNQVINIPPVATLATYTRASNDLLQISIPNLMTNYASDADGDPLTLLSVSSGTNGATVLISGGSISYTPSSSNPNSNTTDYLDYAVTDGFPGGTVTNQIRILINVPLATAATLTQSSFGAGHFTLTFTGGASCTYQVQRTVALKSSGTAWTNIGSATTDSSGYGQFTDTNPPPVQGYYRTFSQ